MDKFKSIFMEFPLSIVVQRLDWHRDPHFSHSPDNLGHWHPEPDSPTFRSPRSRATVNLCLVPTTTTTFLQFLTLPIMAPVRGFGNCHTCMYSFLCQLAQ